MIRIGESGARSDQLLLEGQNREAVDRIWWVVEFVLLVFRGKKVGETTIDGTYLNRVAKSLKRASPTEPDLSPLFKLVLSIAAQLQE